MVGVLATDSIAAFLYAIAQNTAGGGGGGPATVADGANVAEGATADAAYSDTTGAAAGSLVAINKGQYVLQAARLGSLTETAPVSDTASSGLNGRLQRIAQRLTSLITALGTPLQAGGTVILGAGGNIMGIANLAPANSSGAGMPSGTPFRLNSAATVNATLVSTGAHRLISGQVYNSSASEKYLKLYNKAIAPVAGTDTPLHTIVIPSKASLYIADIIGIYGAFFNLGLGIAITGAYADSDTTAVAVGDVQVMLSYL